MMYKSEDLPVLVALGCSSDTGADATDGCEAIYLILLIGAHFCCTGFCIRYGIFVAKNERERPGRAAECGLEYKDL